METLASSQVSTSPTAPDRVSVPIAGTSFVPEPFKAKFMRWLRRATVVGVGLSLVAHVMLLAIAYATPVQGPAQVGNLPEGTAGVQMAVMPAEAFGALEEASIDTTAPSIADGPPTALPGVDMAESPGGNGLADTGDLGTVGTGLGGAGSGQGIGVGDGQGGSGGGGAKFFGVEARGQRFAYVCDVSGSMQGPKLGQLKLELEKSLDALVEQAQFIVYFFESEVFTAGNKPKWSEATGRNKGPVFLQLKGLTARGGTNPSPAFRMAFALKPRPDAIYFMTDGLFDGEVVNEVIAMNRAGKKVPIHCIAFGDRSSEALMKKIATDSGGTYTYVPPPNR